MSPQTIRKNPLDGNFDRISFSLKFEGMSEKHR
jgi:hypothetical protein